MMVDLTGANTRQIEHRGVEPIAGSALWSWWIDPEQQAGTIQFRGKRHLTGPGSPQPCNIEEDIGSNNSTLQGSHLGMPGDEFKIIDPNTGQGFIWSNSQIDEPWTPEIEPDWRLLWGVGP